MRGLSSLARAYRAKRSYTGASMWLQTPFFGAFLLAFFRRIDMKALLFLAFFIVANIFVMLNAMTNTRERHLQRIIFRDYAECKVDLDHCARARALGHNLTVSQDRGEFPKKIGVIRSKTGHVLPYIIY